MEKPPQLIPMNRVVGGVEIQYNPLGRLGMGLQEELHEQPLDALHVGSDLFVPASRVGPDGG